ncbi:AfsR/SARP family transcriptional regulator [Streptomyces silvensis]|uniref:AfsR family transcriptional regulator n=1 Tax=Streptomyces silvensis TaxID=1765722 RepID=A0A0W7X1G5_9ACTN|nr:tetratricopeptide repeat protein [Streptomyces silvensis]KUF16657.1 AfsR family transcriptional regulator [Streptomyces silvensis]
MMDLLALGPLELWQDGRRHELGSPKERCVLAVLVHAHGEPVSLDTLMDRVWDDEPPRTAQDTLQSYLSRLRSRLARAAGEQARLERYAPRLYRLQVAPDALDLQRHRRLRAGAAVNSRRGERHRAIELLRAAEALWRGEPLTEFTGAWARSARTRLLEDHRRVREERIRLELELGRHADLIGELHELATQNPLAQRVIAALMLALYRSGRDDEALGLYRATRARLHDDQGIEPGTDLQELHLRILGQDRGLRTTAARGPGLGADPDPPDAARPAAAVGRRVPDREPSPSNLPRDIRDFTGRRSELRILLRESATPRTEFVDFTAPPSDSTTTPPGPAPAPSALSALSAPTAPSGSPGDTAKTTGSGSPGDAAKTTGYGSRGLTALPLVVVHGMPGVGKTALALHAAHRLTSVCHDGQFYVDLRGYGALPPYDPAEALAVLLHAAGVASVAEDLPRSLDDRVTLWREWTARRHVLVVLDNARDADQVRPLLPGTASCRAIVTSRNRLTGLTGATPLCLEALSTAEATALFTRVAGAGRLASDTAALARAVAACGRHPLALQLLASQFRHRDSWSLEHLTNRLVQAADPLDEFDDDAVASAFTLSYTELPPDSARLLRRLALHPGPDITLSAATALAADEGADAPPTAPAALAVRTRRTLDRLIERNLVEEPVADRYRLHDLTRAFGLRMCLRDEPRTVRRAALERLVHCYLTGAYRAAVRAGPPHRVLLPGPAPACPYAPDFRDADEATAWLSVERGNLLALARAAATGPGAHAVLFPHVLAASLRLWGAWDLAADLFESAVAAARGRDNPPELARALVEHANVLTQKESGKALHRATEALLLFQELNDDRGHADALLQSGRAHFAAGQSSVCLRVLRAAQSLYRHVRDPYGQAEVANMAGVALHAAGRHQEALEQFRTMLRIHEGTGYLYGQLRALNNVGEVHRLDGRHEEARAHYERSLRLAHTVGGRQELANLLTNLGNVCRETGQVEQALAYFRRALTSYRAAGDARGEADTLISLGSTCAAGRQPDEALLAFTEAARIARGIGSPLDLQAALLGTGTALRLLGRYEAARDTHREALRLAREVGHPLGAARALDGLARTALRTQDAPSARGCAEGALELYERLGCEGRSRDLRRALAEAESTSDPAATPT